MLLYKFILITVFPGFPVFWKTLSAINWSVRVRPERHLSICTTVRTGCGVHFLWPSETSAVVISSFEGASSVIKSHFHFTSAYSG